MNELNLAEKARQSPVGVAVLFANNLRRAINILLTFVVLTFGSDFTFWGLQLWELATLLGVFFFFYSFAEWRNFFFYVEQDQFIIEKGIFSRERLNIPFDRIQTVHLTQNVVQRLFGVSGISIDTAGSAQKEMEIAALSGSYARALRHYLQQRKAMMTPEEVTQAETADTADASLQEPLLRLSPRQLVKVGLTENHLRSGFLLFAVVNGYLWQYEEFLLAPFEDFIEQQTNAWLTQGLLLVPIGFVVFIVVAVLFSLVQTVLRYYDLRFYLRRDALSLTNGLLHRNEYNIPVHKIQYLKWQDNPLQRLLRFRTLAIKQASSDADSGVRGSVRVPGLSGRSLLRLLQHYYPPAFRQMGARYPAHRLLFLQRLLWLGLLPAGLAALILYITESSPFFYGAIPPYLALATLAFDRYQRSVKMMVNPVAVHLHSGWFTRQTRILEYYKLQNVALSQSFFQRRRGLMSLHFYTASGQESMPHLPEGLARKLYDYCLYRIGSSRKPWM